MDEQADRKHPGGAVPAIDLGPLPGLIGYALRRAQLVVFHDFHQSFAPVRLRPAQYSVLLVLRRNPGLRQAQVADALGIQPTNFVPLLDELAQRGLAERRRAEDDRRAFALFITASGEALLAEADRLLAEHESRLLARIGPAGRDELVRLLHALGGAE
jgi:DNA-binding MarR family transcriptional regulator